MDRLESFEKMLADIVHQAAVQEEEMAKLKAAGREKSASYRQLFGNKMYYKKFLDIYRQYGLLDGP